MYNITKLQSLIFACASFAIVSSEHALASSIIQRDNVEVTFRGAGWIQGGRIMAISDSVSDGNNYTGNWLQNTGALFNGLLGFDQEISAEFGIGAIKAHSIMGSPSRYANIEGFQSTFLNMARISYVQGGDATNSKLQLTAGLFAYNYNENVKNFGLYLIRGSVFPSTIVSGFETREMVGSANILGLHMRNVFGSFRQDILLSSERDLPPYFDFSPIYIASYRFSQWLEIGGGVNFYHYIPVNKEATNPSEGVFPKSSAEEDLTGLHGSTYARNYAFDVIDSVQIEGGGYKYDTTTIWPSHKGIKLMARAALDFKPLFGIESMKSSDLKFHTEIGVIGPEESEKIYGPITSRMPVVVGLGIPTFFLDELVFEAEYFGSENNPDYGKLVDVGSPIPRSVGWKRGVYNPANPLTHPYDVKKDNWKWSLYGSKVLANHIKISGQLASDHTRMSLNQPVFTAYNETFTRPSDWYMMLKLTFFL